MKKLIVLMSLLLVMIACGKKEPVKEVVKEEVPVVEIVQENLPEWAVGAKRTGNLLEKLTPEKWAAMTDEYGSTHTFTEPYVKEGKVEGSFTIAKKTAEDMWPYVEFVANINNKLTGAKGVKITYKCDKALTVKYPQSDFVEDESYAMYQFTLPVATELTTVFIKTEEFTQPDWTEEANKKPLNLDNVEALYLVPEISYDLGETSNMSVTELEIIGMEL